MKLNTAWTKHIKDPKERKEFEGYVRNCSTLLEVLNNIVEEKINQLNLPKPDYNEAGWAYHQADRHGALRELQFIHDLTNLTKER